MVTKQKVPQSPISFSMHPHIFGKHAMKSEPLGMNSTYFFSVYNTLPQCKIGQDKLGMGHFLTLTNSHCMDSSSEHFKSGCQFSLTTMENKTIARTFSTITCAPLWTYLVFHVLRINFRENGPLVTDFCLPHSTRDEAATKTNQQTTSRIFWGQLTKFEIDP